MRYACNLSTPLVTWTARPALSACRVRTPLAMWSARPATPPVRCFCIASGPDVSRGFDVKEYNGLWHALTHDSTWPSDHSIAVVGPAGDDFVRAVKASCATAAGCTILSLVTQPKTRWQSVRVMLRCTSADDFCALHSSLKGLEGAKAVV